MKSRLKWVGASIPVRLAQWALFALCGLTAALALALSVPGQMSMDTSIQLFEAHVGHSVSWNPPFMSALLAWLGGGELATSLFVLLNVGLLYGSFAVLMGSQLAHKDKTTKRIQSWRVLVCAALILNPVIFIYSGIIWKDVLFASTLAATISLIALASAVSSARVRWFAVVWALVILAAATLTRQQGIVMAPPLLAAVIFSALPAKGNAKRSAILRVLGILVLFSLAIGQLGVAAKSTIRQSNDRGFSVGFQNVFDYDIAGIVYYADKNSSAVNSPSIPEPIHEAIAKSYSPMRIDFLFNNPGFSAWVTHFDQEHRLVLWWQLISRYPVSYAEHRLAVFAALLDVDGVGRCLPVQVGISGNAEYLKALNISPGTGQRGQLLYQVESHFFRSPLFAHWFDVLWLFATIAFVAFSNIAKRTKWLLSCVALSALLLILSYFPTSIACDYRYLFSLVPILTILSFWLLLSPRDSPLREPKEQGNPIPLHPSSVPPNSGNPTEPKSLK